MTVPTDSNTVLNSIRERIARAVPKGWTLTTLGKCFKWSSGGTPRRTEPTYFGGEIPWAVIGDLNDGVITETQSTITEVGLTNSSAKWVEPGSVLVAMYGSIGKLGIVGRRLTTNQAIAFTNPDPVDAKYLYYFLLWQRPSLARLGKGATQLNISQTVLKEFPFLLAPPAEQRRIVSEIEKQFSRLDEAVANLKRVKANLTRYKAAVLKAAVEGSLTSDGDATRWRHVCVADVAQVITGLTKNPKREALPRKLPYLRVANVYANELRLDDVQEIGVADNEVAKLLLRRGDMLVVEGNGSADQIGRVALWDDSIPNCLHQNHLIKVRFCADVMPEWALIWLLSPGGRRHVEQVASSTSGLHTLSTGKVGRLPLPTPPRGEQERLVAEVERRLSILRAMETEADADLARSAGLRQSVLAKGFDKRGQPRVVV